MVKIIEVELLNGLSLQIEFYTSYGKRKGGKRKRKCTSYRDESNPLLL